MAKALIVVESPAKIKTLKQFLGSSYIFESSYGHVRDLPESGLGINIEQDFEPTYEAMAGKKEVIDRLKKAAKEVDVVYLSPDPDREGEAIAWHISQILPKDCEFKRVTFNSITKEAVQEALKHPRAIDMALVDAQQARRLLDRLVGYTISPLLNRRLRRGRSEPVSAGRVQSVALKLVVDREREIEAFKPVEYWNLAAHLKRNPEESLFKASLLEVDGKKVEKEIPEGKKADQVFLIPNQTVAEEIKQALEISIYTIEKIERKEKRRHPEAPFITSTLQQEASRHFRFSPSKTMEIAQNLYEGIDLGDKGTQGLITYMRTDSVRAVPEAIEAARGYIKQSYTSAFLPSSPRLYQTKKSAQDAHEAIRPVDVHLTPDIVQPYVSREQHLLYSLIWKRFVASQMASAIYDTVSVDISASERFLLRTTGSQITFMGFLTLYEEKHDEEEEEAKEPLLPNLEEGKKLILNHITADQAFTRPPARFTEATLVKELEKSGIGRPSTYATIMNKIQSRDYTTKEAGRLKPTELGRIITEMMESNFDKIVNVGFTADMENSLEEVADSKTPWKMLLNDFWKDFSPVLTKAENEAFVPRVQTDMTCPLCGGIVQKIWFKNKYFLGCSNYPTCSWTSSVEEAAFDKSEYDESFDWDQVCPQCASPMKVRFGKFGAFLGCTKYPECRGIINIPKKGEAISISQESRKCPAVGCEGNLTQKRSRFGKLFWSCSEYPKCDVIGNTVEDIEATFTGRPKTPSEKKSKKRLSSKKAEKTESSTKKRTSKKGVAKAATTKTSTAKTGKGTSKSKKDSLDSDTPSSVPKKQTKKKTTTTKKSTQAATTTKKKKSATKTQSKKQPSKEADKEPGKQTE